MTIIMMQAPEIIPAPASHPKVMDMREEQNGDARSYSRQPIDGKVVVVTGASGGVGRALVRELGRRGCRVALLARGRDGLEAAKTEVEQLGGKALVLPADVANADQIE